MTENKSKKPVWNKQDENRYNSLYNKLKQTTPELNKQDYLYNYNKKKYNSLLII